MVHEQRKGKAHKMVSVQQAMLEAGLKSLGLQCNVKIIETKGYRWTVDYKQDPNYPDFGKNMIKLEKWLQVAMKGPIDLRLKPEPDKNKREERNVLE